MLARVADNLYWLARYLERAENTGAPGQRQRQPDARSAARLRAGLAAADRHHRQPAVDTQKRRSDEREIVQFILADAEESRARSAPR